MSAPIKNSRCLKASSFSPCGSVPAGTGLARFPGTFGSPWPDLRSQSAACPGHVMALAQWQHRIVAPKVLAAQDRPFGYLPGACLPPSDRCRNSARPLAYRTLRIGSKSAASATDFGRRDRLEVRPGARERRRWPCSRTSSASCRSARARDTSSVPTMSVKTLSVFTRAERGSSDASRPAASSITRPERLRLRYAAVTSCGSA